MAKFFPATQEEIDALKTRIAKVAPKAAFANVGAGQHIDHAILRARPSVHVVETKGGLAVLVDKRLKKAALDEYATKLSTLEKQALAAKILLSADLPPAVEEKPTEDPKEPINDPKLEPIDELKEGIK